MLHAFGGPGNTLAGHYDNANPTVSRGEADAEAGLGDSESPMGGLGVWGFRGLGFWVQGFGFGVLDLAFGV